MADPNDAAGDAAPATPRILIIEDEPDVAALLKRMLEASAPCETRIETAPGDFAALLGDSTQMRRLRDSWTRSTP